MRSWETDEGEQRSLVEVTAEEVGPSLKWATAKPERAARKANGEAGGKGEFADEPGF
jgi:single-strand DNA-binding protein